MLDVWNNNGLIYIANLGGDWAWGEVQLDPPPRPLFSTRRLESARRSSTDQK